MGHLPKGRGLTEFRHPWKEFALPDPPVVCECLQADI
jgi:hypothetical protein